MIPPTNAPKVKRVWIEISEFGELVCYYPNMKSIYKMLCSQQVWVDKVNYSYFSRVLNKENTRMWWYITPSGQTVERRFLPVHCALNK